jgi:hypothetical protein
MYAALANGGDIDGKRFLSRELVIGLTQDQPVAGSAHRFPDGVPSRVTDRRFPGCSTGSATSVSVERSDGPIPTPAARSRMSTTGC